MLDMPLAVCAAILLSAVVLISVATSGLHRKPFCLVPSLGVVVLVWLAYPPAQQLPPIVSIIFWALIAVALYHFPTPSPAPSPGSAVPTDDELLEHFFTESQSQ